MGTLSRIARALVPSVALLCAAVPPGVAQAADEAVRLYKVASARDEIVIGVDTKELPELDMLADRLAKAGYVVAWQYGPTRAAGGETVQSPLRRVAVFAGQIVRIEPFASEQRIVAPQR